jgi:hypothetical protein
MNICNLFYLIAGAIFVLGLITEFLVYFILLNKIKKDKLHGNEVFHKLGYFFFD